MYNTLGEKYAYFNVFYNVNEFYVLLFFMRNFYDLIIIYQATLFYNLRLVDKIVAIAYAEDTVNWTTGTIEDNLEDTDSESDADSEFPSDADIAE